MNREDEVDKLKRGRREELLRELADKKGHKTNLRQMLLDAMKDKRGSSVTQDDEGNFYINGIGVHSYGSIRSVASALARARRLPAGEDAQPEDDKEWKQASRKGARRFLAESQDRYGTSYYDKKTGTFQLGKLRADHENISWERKSYEGMKREGRQKFLARYMAPQEDWNAAAGKPQDASEHKSTYDKTSGAPTSKTDLLPSLVVYDKTGKPVQPEDPSRNYGRRPGGTSVKDMALMNAQYARSQAAYRVAKSKWDADQRAKTLADRDYLMSAEGRLDMQLRNMQTDKLVSLSNTLDAMQRAQKAGAGLAIKDDED